jgi:glycosyltransferase involved in cell wall biosynthesis
MNNFIKQKGECSIIIPTWNRSKKLFYLIKKLEKIAPKIFCNYEILICDSNSSDNTKILKKKFKSKRVKHYHAKFNSISLKRNLGIKMSKYDDLIFFDDDCLPNLKLLKLFSFFLKQKKYNKIYFGKYYISKNLINRSNFYYFRNKQNEIAYNAVINNRIDFTKIISGNMCFNKKIIKRYKLYFNENIDSYGCEDIEWGYRLERFGIELILVNAYCIHHELNFNLINFLKKWQYMGEKSVKLLRLHNNDCYKKTNFFLLENIYKKFFFLSKFTKIILYFFVNILKKTDKFKFIRIYLIFKSAIILSFMNGINLRKKL